MRSNENFLTKSSVATLIFDIKEFAVNDGPGVRVTVFFKGCPLRCCWCHNPEGLDFHNEFNLATGQLTAKEWTSEHLFEYLCKFKDLFQLSGGGVTFSGGEPLYNSLFLSSLVDSLFREGIHTAIETSGYVKKSIFIKTIDHIDLTLFDLKVMDACLHEQYTGVSNQLIIENCKVLSRMGKKYWIRVPLIPRISDTKENLLSTLNFILEDLDEKPERVELLNYNRFAGAKYPNYNKKFTFKNAEEVNIDLVESFVKLGSSKGLKISFLL